MFYWVSSHGLFAKSLSPTDFTDLHRCESAFKGVHLSPLGFAACQSKKCTNRAKSIFSHRFHGSTQM